MASVKMLVSMTSSSALLTCALILLVVVFTVDRIRTFRRLSHIPGPTLGAFSKVWMIRACTAGRNHLLVAEVNAKYGSLARIGPNNLVTSDPDLIRRMNAPRSEYRRGDWYNAMRMKPGFNNVLSERSEDRHKELREKMAQGYSGKENPGLEQSIDGRVLDLVNLIDRKYISKGTSLKKMDLARIAQFFTLDVISDIAFDSAFGDLVEGEDKFEYIKITEENLPILILMAILPQIHQFLEKSYLMS
jgi:cytochrome P450